MDNVVKNPIYQKSELSRNELEEGYLITFDSLGIKGDSITEIDVMDSNSNSQCVFFIKDENTLILYGGGAFFKLHKK